MLNMAKFKLIQNDFFLVTTKTALASCITQHLVWKTNVSSCHL